MELGEKESLSVGTSVSFRRGNKIIMGGNFVGNRKGREKGRQDQVLEETREKPRGQGK